MAFLVPALGWCPPRPWDQRVAEVIYSFLVQKKETVWFHHGEKIPVTFPYLVRIVDADLAAAPLNPGWGSPRLCAKRHLASQYRESRLFWLEVSRKIGANGYPDDGLEQINEGQWKTEDGYWPLFCQSQGLPYDPENQVWVPEINAKFAAWWNQRAIDWDMDLYHFNRNTSVKQLYARLLKVKDEDPFWSQ